MIMSQGLPQRGRNWIKTVTLLLISLLSAQATQYVYTWSRVECVDHFLALEYNGAGTVSLAGATPNGIVHTNRGDCGSYPQGYTAIGSFPITGVTGSITIKADGSGYGQTNCGGTVTIDVRSSNAWVFQSCSWSAPNTQFPTVVVEVDLPCGAGVYGVNGGTGCTVCKAGSFCPGNGVQNICSSPGTYSNAGATGCSTCTGATYSLGNGATSCINCGSGYYTNGGTGCYICDVNNYCPGDGTKTACPANSFSPKGASSCTCSAGYSQIIRGTTLTCSVCSAGTYASSGSTFCVPCAANTYAYNTAASSCSVCPPNSGSTAGSSTCSCSSGYSASSPPPVQSCTPCKAGYSSSGGSTPSISACFACAADTFANSPAGGASACITCPAHSHSPTSATSCTCEAGYSQSGSGTSLSCTVCKGGYFSPTPGSTSCQLCPTNTHSQEASTSCSNCPSFSSSAAGSSTCTCYAGYAQSGIGKTLTCSLCPAGSFSRAGDSLCSPCPVNTYSRTGASMCTPCAPSSTTLGATGSSTCTCNEGYAHSGIADSVTCTSCQANQFSPAGSPTCIPCPPHSTSVAMSATCVCNDPIGGPWFTVGRGVTLQCLPAPTSQPTGQPSDQPSRRPSRTPSSQPTRQPSRRPTRKPSSQPTGQPSRRPSHRPTTQPSGQPTNRPSCKPSRQPSSQPTYSPSAPTSQPSNQPSTQPSYQPISNPTMVPTQFVNPLPGKMAYFKVEQEIDNIDGSWNSSSLSDFLFQETVAAVVSKASVTKFESVYILSVTPLQPANINNTSTTTSTAISTVPSTSSLLQRLSSLRHLQGSQQPPLQTTSTSSSVLVLYIINFYSTSTTRGDDTTADAIITSIETAVANNQFTSYLNNFAINVQVSALVTAVARKPPIIIHMPVAYEFTNAPTGTQTRAPEKMTWHRLILICSIVAGIFGFLSLVFCGYILYLYASHKYLKSSQKYKEWDLYQNKGIPATASAAAAPRQNDKSHITTSGKNANTRERGGDGGETGRQKLVLFLMLWSISP